MQFSWSDRLIASHFHKQKSTLDDDDGDVVEGCNEGEAWPQKWTVDVIEDNKPSSATWNDNASGCKTSGNRGNWVLSSDKKFVVACISKRSWGNDACMLWATFGFNCCSDGVRSCSVGKREGKNSLSLKRRERQKTHIERVCWKTENIENEKRWRVKAFAKRCCIWTHIHQRVNNVDAIHYRISQHPLQQHIVLYHLASFSIFAFQSITIFATLWTLS